MTTPLAFGTTPQGEAAKLFQLGSEQMRVQLTNFGGRLVAIELRGIAGTFEHILLGFDSAAEYCAAGQSFGALLGRTANRIAGGRFCLGGRWYELSRNDHGNTLHGGERGFENRLWEVENATHDHLHLSLLSEDGDQGFPGNVAVSVHYRLEGSTLSLEFDASTDQPTPLSLSAHPYFNLGGLTAHDVLDHEITLVADSYLPTDAAQIPTGEIATVAATPFDFRSPTPIGRRIGASHIQLGYGRGYDHYFVAPEQGQQRSRWVARARHPGSGRCLDVWTTQPGLQFYTGNQLNGASCGRGGRYRQSAGFAFEPQGYPNAPNEPTFPSMVLSPEAHYREVIEYRFSNVFA